MRHTFTSKGLTFNCAFVPDLLTKWVNKINKNTTTGFTVQWVDGMVCTCHCRRCENNYQSIIKK